MTLGFVKKDKGWRKVRTSSLKVSKAFFSVAVMAKDVSTIF